MYHHTKFKLPSAFHKKYMNVQSSKCQLSCPTYCVLSPSNNPSKCQNCNFDKIRPKQENTDWLFDYFIAFYTFSIGSTNEMKHYTGGTSGQNLTRLHDVKYE